MQPGVYNDCMAATAPTQNLADLGPIVTVRASQLRPGSYLMVHGQVQLVAAIEDASSMLYSVRVAEGRKLVAICENGYRIGLAETATVEVIELRCCWCGHSDRLGRGPVSIQEDGKPRHVGCFQANLYPSGKPTPKRTVI